jgi:hypothetical protein
MSRLYIAYGSNLNLRQMKVRCPAAEVLGVGALPGYQLLFRGWDGSAVATVEPSQEAQKVPVLLWALQPKDERTLDRYEGWPTLYRKETVTVEINDKPVEAMAYIMNKDYPLGRPSGRYLTALLEGYESAGFDTDILFRAAARSAPVIAEGQMDFQC